MAWKWFKNDWSIAGLAILLVAYIFEEGTRLYKEQN